MRRLLSHLVVACGFVALAVAWTLPLSLHLSTRLPGYEVGDNVVFLWNFWWMRVAWASDLNFFQTPYLFAPVGANLTLNTHTALPAFVGATILGRLPIVAALNVTILTSLALNGFCAYLLAWRLVRQRAPAILAGVIFATTPYVAAHLNGHFNLTTVWMIPLFALAMPGVLSGSMAWALVAGAVLGMTAYVDYYYVIYEIALAVCLVLLHSREWTFTHGVRQPYGRWLSVAVSVAIAIVLVAIITIASTGGFSARVGPIQVSARGIFNLSQALWVLVAIGLWIRYRPAIAARRRPEWSLARAIVGIAVLSSVAAVVAAPVLVGALRLVADEAYVTQPYQWRNAPVGTDIATLLLGHPFHGLWGRPVRGIYAELEINVLESGAWLGIVPVLLAALAVRRWRQIAVVREWLALGVVFFVWALGSHLHAAGVNLGLILPQVLLRYVPIAANARMPGRAMVIAYLSLAILAAFGVAGAWRRRSAAAVAVCVMAVVVEFGALPIRTVPIDCPPIYNVLRDRPERGALAELPLGVADGIREITRFDFHSFTCQTVHGRPLVGGVLSRVPSNILTAYRSDPLIATWLRLSGASEEFVPLGAPADTVVAAARMAADEIAFVMIDRRTASPALQQYVDDVLPVVPIATDDDHTLYVRTSGSPSAR